LAEPQALEQVAQTQHPNGRGYPIKRRENMITVETNHTDTHQVLYSPIWVVEAGTQSTKHLITGETHLHHVVNGVLQCFSS
jgi:hypothetical protein